MSDSSAPRRLVWRITAVFGVAMALALGVPVGSPEVVLLRSRYAVWVSILFVAAAFALALQGGRHRSRRQLYTAWRLLWTYGFLAYAVHFWLTFVRIYGGEVRMVVEQQTLGVALANFLFTAWWAVDLAIGWRSEIQAWQRHLSTAFQFFCFGVFVTAFVFLRPGVPFYLGIVLIVTVLTSGAFRVFETRLSNPRR